MREVDHSPRWRNVFGGIFAVLAAAMLMPFLPYAGQTAWADEANVVINEIYPSPNTDEKEWVELYNPTSKTVDLTGWTIREEKASPVELSGELKPGAWLVVEVHDFNNDGDTATLKDEDGDVDTVEYPAINKGKSYARTSDGSTEWEKNVTATKNSWNLLDVNAPELTDLKVTNPGRWSSLNLWEDSRFKAGSKIIVGGTIKLGATFSDDQRLEEASIKVEGEGEEKTFSGDEVTQEGANPANVTATWNTGDRDGDYTAIFTAKDGGKIFGELPNETTRTIDLVVDNTAPTVFISELQDKADHDLYFEGSLTVKPALEDSNGISRVWLGIRKSGEDGSTEIKDEWWPENNWSHEFDTSVYTDGVYELLVKAWDIAGNESSTYTESIVLNNFPPTIPALGDLKSGTTVNGQGAVLDWMDSEDGNGRVTYKFQWSTTSDMKGIVATESREGLTESAKSIPVGQPDGTYFWRVQACDKFGVCSAWSDTWSIIIDTTGPALTVNSLLRNGDGTYTVSGTTDEDTPIFIYLDEEFTPVEIQPLNGLWSYTTDVPLILGEHTFTVKSYDAVGNEGETDVTFSVEIEPVVQVLSEPPRPLAVVSESPAAVIAATSPVAPDVLEEAIKTNAEVLGTSATEPDDAAAVEATPRGWLLLGVEWYWWLLGLSGVGTGGWLFMRRRGTTGI